MRHIIGVHFFLLVNLQKFYPKVCDLQTWRILIFADPCLCVYFLRPHCGEFPSVPVPEIDVIRDHWFFNLKAWKIVTRCCDEHFLYQQWKAFCPSKLTLGTRQKNKLFLKISAMKQITEAAYKVIFMILQTNAWQFHLCSYRY